MTIFKVLGNPQNANEPKCKTANEAQQSPDDRNRKA